MKTEWEVRPLGEVATAIMGQAPAGKDCNKEGVGVPFVKAGEFGPERPVIREWTTDPKKFAKQSDVLICVVGATCGKINLGADCAIGRSAAALRPNPTQLDQFYLHYFLQGIVQRLRASSQGAAQTVISKSMLYDIPIPLPSLEEQRRVVAVLDEAFEGLNRARENTETNLTNARELFESVLFDLYEVQMKGLKRKRLSDVCDLISGQHIEAKDYNAEGIGIGYLTGPSDFGDINPVVTKWTEYPKRTALAGDILITVKGSGVGSVNIMNHDELAISRQLMAIRSKGIPIRYLFGFIRMQQGHFKSLSNGAAIPGISRGDVLELEIPIPLNANQDKYVEYLVEAESHVNIAEQAYTAELSDLADLRQSLLQKAFAGELT